MNENLLSQDVYVGVWVIIYSIIQYNKTEIAYSPPPPLLWHQNKTASQMRQNIYQDIILSIGNWLDCCCLIVNS